MAGPRTGGWSARCERHHDCSRNGDDDDDIDDDDAADAADEHSDGDKHIQLLS